MSESVPWLSDNGWWIFMYVFVTVWQGIGWGAIVYLSAITGIDQEMYEAAKVDGCSRFKMMTKITLPSIRTTIVIMLILRVGGMMSIDFGGPINKAAYVFGTASLMSASGQAVSSGIMASVMVGGMVPPLAIALAMLLFKGKFTPKERQSTITNFIMGLSFITEGAIPFAASDPVHVIPPCAIGAAVAGALSMLFNCALPAPHGGIFVFGVITNWPMYIVALVAGVIVAAILLGIFRKKRPQD